MIKAPKFWAPLVEPCAATFQWGEANGAGETLTLDRAEANWKNIDDSTTAYSSSPIAAGANSYSKWMFGKFSGTFNQISAGLFAHTAGAMGTGLTIKGQPAMTVDADRLSYTTPATASLAGLSFDQTSAIAIGSGRAVWFGATGPAASGKAATMTTNPCFTNYLTHQLQTTGSAAAGDTTQATFTLRYDEN
jgi:hypothetical protein